MRAVKSRIEDLAIFGGPPAFREELHVGRPNVGERETFLQRVNDLLDRRWLTNDGPLLQEFERRICQLIGVKHCVALCNATIGLEVAVKTLDLSGEVILPSFTFISTAHGLRWLGVTPVFCDVDPAIHTIEPRLVEVLSAERARAPMRRPVWARTDDVDLICDC